ncbi:hypothetical protein BDD12DRAFT_389116 [Trichophaea hybrida]|nr:hypothetical protein BDD12DRAFT_389116 [Trichophaea hybrida]
MKGNSAKTLTIPLELKTGRSQSIEHRAQTMLYTLLMSDRYDINVHTGLLYYMEANEMIRVPAIKDELRELIIKRNQVASYMYMRETLPEMRQDEHACSRCYAKTSCFVYHKLFEGGTAESSGVVKPFLETTGHLNAKHEAFFKHWDTLLTKEEKGSMQFRRELWTMTSSEREATGRCFANLVIVPDSIAVDQSNQKINKYRYSFQKQHSTSAVNFIEAQLSEGDPIVVSDEKGHIALAIGFVSRIHRDRVTVQVDRRLHNTRTRQKGFNEDSNQVFNGIVELRGSQQQSQSQGICSEEILYRVDKDEFSNGMANIPYC